MMFLNTYDIDEARRAFDRDPILGPAARTLASLRDAADAHSDGWAYWPKPCRAASKLQELIQRATDRRYGRSVPPVTASEVRDALRSIRAFRTRSGLAFTIEAPEENTPEVTR